MVQKFCIKSNVSIFCHFFEISVFKLDFMLEIEKSCVSLQVYVWDMAKSGTYRTLH